MARIPVYNDPVSAQAPLPGRSPERLYAEPESFGSGAGPAALGRSLDETGNQLYNVAQRQEVSDVTAKLAQARSTWTNELAQRASKATPGDPAFADTFNADFQADISKLGDNINTVAGQQAFQRGSANLTADMSMAAGRFQIQSAGVKAKQDYTTALNANSAVLYHDPTQFGSVLQQTETDLQNPNGPYAGMPADAREALRLQTRETLATSAFQGIVRLNPDLAKQQLTEGKWDQYVPSDHMFRLESLADTAIRGQEVESMRLEMAQQKAQAAAQKATEDKFVQQWAKDPTSLSAMDIANSNLAPAAKIEFINMARRAAAPDPIKTDPETYLNLFQRIHAPDNDPTKITDDTDLNPYVGKGLTFGDLQQLRGEIAGKKTQDGDIEAQLKKGLYQVAKSSLTGTDELLHLRDPKGDEQLQKFTAQFLPAYKAARDAGKTPTQLLDPDSPDYMGKAIAPLKRSPAQFMQNLIDNNPGQFGEPAAGATPAVKPGATIPLPPPEYKTQADVAAAYKAGTITRAEAEKTLRDKGWAE